MKTLVYIFVVALLVAAACGDEDTLENWEGFMELVKRGKAQLRANPYYLCQNEMTGADCVCNRLYRKDSPKHQTLCLGQ